MVWARNEIYKKRSSFTRQIYKETIRFTSCHLQGQEAFTPIHKTAIYSHLHFFENTFTELSTVVFKTKILRLPWVFTLVPPLL